MRPPKGSGTMNDEETAPEWERIKSWVGSRNPQSKHPVIEHMEREQRKDNPQKMDDGGMAGFNDGFDPNKILQEIAPPGVGTLTPSPAAPQMQQPIQAPPPPVPQPAAPVVQTPAPQAPIAPTPQAPPPQLSNLSEGQTAASVLGTDPQKLKDFLMKVNAPTWKDRLGNAGTGFADAIMQGVAKAGPGHFQENFQKQQQDNRTNLSAIPGQVAAVGEKGFGINKDIDADNPQSMKSFVAQKSYAPLLAKNGFSPQEIKQIPASAIEALAQGGLKASEIRNTYLLQKEIHAQTAEYQQGNQDIARQTLQANRENNQAQRALQEQGHQQEAAKTLADQGLLKRITSKLTGNTGEQVLQNQAQGVKSFNSVDEAEAAGLPVGTRVSIGGRMATIK